MTTGGFGDNPVPLVQANGQGRRAELDVHHLALFGTHATKRERGPGGLRCDNECCGDQLLPPYRTCRSSWNGTSSEVARPSVPSPGTVEQPERIRAQDQRLLARGQSKQPNLVELDGRVQPGAIGTKQ